MKDEKTTANDPERTLLTLDQLSQTIEVMTNVVNRLREHLSAQLNAQAAAQARLRESHGENEDYAGMGGFPEIEAFNENDSIEEKMATIEKLDRIGEKEEMEENGRNGESRESGESGKSGEGEEGGETNRIEKIKQQFPAALTAEQLASPTEKSGKQAEQTTGNQADINPKRKPGKGTRKETSIAAQQDAGRKAGRSNTKAEKHVSFVVEITQTDAKPRRKNPKILH